MTDVYETWASAAQSGTYTLLPDGAIQEAFGWTSQNGPVNCWTGTLGHAAATMRRLLRERLHLLKELERAKGESDEIDT